MRSASCCVTSGAVTSTSWTTAGGSMRPTGDGSQASDAVVTTMTSRRRAHIRGASTACSSADRSDGSVDRSRGLPGRGCMRVVDVSESYSSHGGGVRTYVHAKLAAARRLGHELVIIAPGVRD